MPEQYTITQQGAAWVASNGDNHVEADDPSEALFLLLGGEIDAEEGVASVEESARERSAGDEEERFGLHAVLLIRLMAYRVPAPILRKEMRILAETLDRYLSLRGD